MSTKPLSFSVIITLFNKAPYIARTLKSIFYQDRKVDEIVIIDDVSTDNSLEVVKQTIAEESVLCEDIDIRIVERKTNGGPSIARNTALKIASGDYLFLLDADDEYHPGFFSKAEHIFASYQANLLFYQFERDINGRVLPIIDELLPIIEKLEENIYFIPNIIAALGHDSFGMNGSSVACKRSALENHFYQENLNCFEGLDFWFRVANAIETQKGKAILLSGVQVTIHLTKDSVSRKLVNDGGEIYLPSQFEQFRYSKNRDEQRLRKRIFTIWMRNAFLKIPDLWPRMVFLWQFRHPIITNVLLNIRYR